MRNDRTIRPASGLKRKPWLIHSNHQPCYDTFYCEHTVNYNLNEKLISADSQIRKKLSAIPNLVGVCLG